jgi:hypothetical protein
VLREATRSSIQIAGLSSVDFGADAISIRVLRLRALPCSEPPWCAGSCSANCDPETSDQRSGRRIRKSSTGNVPRNECHGYEHQDDSYETRQ